MSVTEHGTESLLHAVICQWQKNTWQRTDWLKQPTCCSCKQRSSVEIVKCRLGGLNYLLHTQTYTNTMFLTGDVMYIYIYIYTLAKIIYFTLDTDDRRTRSEQVEDRWHTLQTKNKKQNRQQTAFVTRAHWTDWHPDFTCSLHRIYDEWSRLAECHVDTEITSHADLRYIYDERSWFAWCHVDTEITYITHRLTLYLWWEIERLKSHHTLTYAISMMKYRNLPSVI